MRLGYGLISCQRSPGDPRTWGDLYREALVLAEDADRLGLASVWTTEHHFVDDGYMPSVLPVSAAIAARTARIEVGTGVLLAPLYHPLRLAEDAATVSLLSGGRLVLGLGLGWSEVEFAALGADRSQRGRAMTEILGILGQAWSGDVVRHRGRVYDLPEVAVRPVPDRRPPVIIGGGVDAAVRRAARHADGFFSNASPRRFAEQVRVAREALEDAGRDPETFSWTYYGMVHLGADPDAAWEEIRDHVWAMRWKYADMVASASRRGPIPPPPPPDAATRQQLRKATLVGSAEDVAATIHGYREQAGVEFDFVARSYWPAMGLGRQREIVERLASELMPALG